MTLCWHKWTDWAIEDHGKVKWYSDTVGLYIGQTRHCLKCGKTGLKVSATYGSAPPSFCRFVSDGAVKVPRKDGVKA